MFSDSCLVLFPLIKHTLTVELSVGVIHFFKRIININPVRKINVINDWA